MCIGAKSDEEARAACLQFVNILRMVGLDAKLESYAVQNSVCSAEAGFQIDLDALAKSDTEWTTYEVLSTGVGYNRSFVRVGGRVPRSNS